MGKLGLAVIVVAALGLMKSADAGPFFFSTGDPDGLLGTLSGPGGIGSSETETADDFNLTQATIINSATFTGLIPSNLTLSDITNVNIELYHVFPRDSNEPPSGNVPSRANSPSDVEITSATRDSSDGSLSFSVATLSSNFTVNNTVINGINPSPNNFTGGDGPANGSEILFSIVFNTPLVLPADHYFFRPEVTLTSGNFLWLSAPKPISGPSAFNPDLQSWIRNSDLDPDWLRIGNDITHQGPFNAAFSLTGQDVITQAVPEPSSLLVLCTGVPMVVIWRRGRRLSS